MKLTIQPAPVLKLMLQPENNTARIVSVTQPVVRLSIAEPSEWTPVKGEKGDTGPQGPQGPAGPASTIKRDVIVLNGTHISTKIVNLTSSPATDWVFLIPDKGIPQRAGIDFFLDRNDNTIKWMGMGLDGVLRVNDRLEVHYFI